MTDGGLAAWLIPSEFMDVNYGISVKRYLLNKVTLLHIHRFDPNDVQFGDARCRRRLSFYKEAPSQGHEVRFTYGGSLERPKLERLVPVDTLRSDPKWTRYPMKEKYEAGNGPVLGVKITRGLATGNNNYFILSADDIKRRELPMEAFDIAESSLPVGRRGSGGQHGKRAGTTVIPAGLPVGGSGGRKAVSEEKERPKASPNAIFVAVVCAGKSATVAVRVHLSRPE